MSLNMRQAFDRRRQTMVTMLRLIDGLKFHTEGRLLRLPRGQGSSWSRRFAEKVQPPPGGRR